jgi:hypothetical protein
MPLSEELETNIYEIRHDTVVTEDGTVVIEPWVEEATLFTMFAIEVDGIPGKKHNGEMHHTPMFTLKSETAFRLDGSGTEYLTDTGQPWLYENGPPIVESHYLRMGHIVADGDMCDLCEEIVREEKWQVPQKIGS